MARGKRAIRSELENVVQKYLLGLISKYSKEYGLDPVKVAETIIGKYNDCRALQLIEKNSNKKILVIPVFLKPKQLKIEEVEQVLELSAENIEEYIKEIIEDMAETDEEDDEELGCVYCKIVGENESEVEEEINNKEIEEEKPKKQRGRGRPRKKVIEEKIKDDDNNEDDLI